MENTYFDQMMASIVQLDEVEAILLAGSRATGSADGLSDYDVYVYVSAEIPLIKREEIARKYCSYMEINNQFWETEDDGVLKNGTEIELIYRELSWLDAELERVLFNCQASTGYSTCFWANLLNSIVLFDRSGKATELINKYSISYPEELRSNIIDKNYLLLSQSMPAYRKQISKAISRNDAISVNHRISELLASYFDIIFALNKIPHPGEKRLMEYSLSQCELLPVEFEEKISELLSQGGRMSHCLDSTIEQLIGSLADLLRQEGLGEAGL